MERFVVDRLEGSYAVCFDEKNRKHDILLENIDFSVKEGIFILYDKDKNKYFADTESTKKAMKKNETRLKNLFERK